MSVVEKIIFAMIARYFGSWLLIHLHCVFMQYSLVFSAFVLRAARLARHLAVELGYLLQRFT